MKNRVEIWKPVIGYEGLYKISNMGRVKSIKFNKEKILFLQKDKYGYLRVGLRKMGKLKNYFVHRLVAEAFIPNPNNLPIVNHKDENKQNNCVENLEWCTVKYNNSYGSAIFKRKEKLKKTIVQYTLTNTPIKEWRSAKDIEMELGLSHQLIGRCCLNKCKSAYGYIWKYKRTA